MISKNNITIIGAGLSGPVMATYLSNHGYEVDIYERRPDMRHIEQSAGRSINLALSKRGIKALKDIGVYKEIRTKMLPMEGRMIHDLDGSTHLHPYGKKQDEVIYSISRSFLNITLMEFAEKNANTKIYFEHDLDSLDVISNRLIFKNKKSFPYVRVLGSDGSSSIIRKSINQFHPINYQKKPLLHGYKELAIPPNDKGDFRLEPKALHIWPRGKFMLIALPNMDRSFTCTLFLPLNGEVSFSTIKSKNQIPFV